jgi:type VI secretion system protein ImpL
MKKILAFLISRWCLSLIGALVICALIWFFGPFLAWLAGLIVRLILIIAVLLVWLGVNLWLGHVAKKRDQRLAYGVAAVSPADQAAAGEVAALSEKLKTSLALLRKARGTKGYIYEQPWYVIIGPPGAGKTTALLNAGLKFPLAAALGQGATAGVGGTRLCDWWFTEEAVLIDTAGRYTTQDSNATVDKAGWEGFLDLLKATRKRQALNGIIVAISLADIATGSRDERIAHARAIRARVQEITARLGIKVPVYALLTKADLIAGFTEFFDDLDAERRGQVWGTTFAPKLTPRGPVEAFAQAFDELVARLDERMIDLLAAERSPDRRALIVGFPAQVASLKEPINEFLTEAFAGSTLDPAPFLRGIYMASGTQEGTPIDRLTGALSRAFGIDQRRAPSLRAATGRSYFLARLLRDVIFNEAMLGTANPAAVRRHFLLRAGGFAAIGLVFLGLLAGLLISRANNAQAITASAGGLATYTGTAASLPLNPVADTNVLAILPLLDQARALPFGPGDTAAHTGMGFGLDQEGKLASGAATTYANALDNAFLPRLILQLEAEMRGGFDRPEFLYQATRVYLMLGGQAPSVSKPLIEAWMRLDWQRLYPGLAAQPVRDDLMTHLVALLDNPLPSVPLDGALVESARATFSRVSVAARVYSRIRDSADAASVPAWIPAEAMGQAGVGLFTRASGKPLTDGVPGFFTVKGFHFVLLPALTHAAQTVADESWVLGPDQQVDPQSPEMQNLEKDVILLYEHDYETAWNDMLGDLNIQPPDNIGGASQALYVLSSPQSPMAKLLNSVSTELQLSKAPALPPGAQAAQSKLPGVAKVDAEAAALQGLMGPATATTAPTPPGSEVDAYYAPLIDYIGTGTGAPMTLTLNLLSQLQQQLAALATAVPGGGAPTAPAAGGDPAALLQGEEKSDPQPVARWLAGLVVDANGLRGGSAAQAAAAAFNGAGGPAQLCQQAVANRYPFSPGSSQDIPLGDFTHLFMPNGLIDTFFSQQVRQFVDMSGATWRIQAVNSVAPPISQGALAAFQRAETIRQLFFAAGAQPSVQFSITPVSLDASAAQVTLELGALNVSYAHGPPVPTQISWPGADGMQTARLIITSTAGGNPVEIDAAGPWALFRLFSEGSLQQTGSSDQYLLTFAQGGHTASFTISAGSVLNPFAPGVLVNFKCPSLQG